MSTEIENRVVQLEMDNKSLEKNSKQSIKTLEKLDKALEFKNGKKSFDDVEKAAEKCNFEPLLKAAEKVNERFSTMGIMGVRALERITDKALDAGLSITKSLTIDQIASGYSKYEQKTQSVQTLVNSTGKSVKEINKYLDQLMWFSDETSYSFTDMVSALATMSSSGGDINKLIPMIQGVANATAFAGKGASEFTRVMYNLNQSYTAGYLSYMDWKSVEQAGAASKQLKQILLDVAVAEGKVKKGQADISNFNNLLSKKVFSREVMEKGFGYFNEMTAKAYEMIGTLDEQGNKIETASQAYEILAQEYDSVSLRAAKSAQEAKSFSEAISSTKDAVSSQWLKIFENVFGDYDQQVELWTGLANGLYEIFATPLSDIADLFGDAFQSTPIGTVEDSLSDCGIEVDAFKEKLIEVAKASGKVDEAVIDETTASISSVKDLLNLDWVDSSMVSSTMDYYSKALETGTKVTKEFVSAADLADRMKTGEFGNRWNYKQLTKNLQEAGYDIANAQDVFKLAKKDPTAKIRMMGELTEKNTESLENAAAAAKNFNHEFYDSNSGRTIGLEAIKNVLSAIGDRIDMVKKAWGDIFPSATADNIKNAIISFHKWSETLKMGEDQGDRIYNVASKIFGAIKKGLTIIGKVISLTKTLVKSIVGIAKAFFALEPVQVFINGVKNTLSDVYNFISGKILSAIEKCQDFINSHLNPTTGELGDGLNRVGNMFRKISDRLAPLYKFAKQVGGYALNILSRIWQVLAPYANLFYEKLIVPFTTFIGEVIDSDDPIGTLTSGIGRFVKKASNGFNNLIRKIRNFSLKDFLSNVNSKFQDTLDKFPALRNAFENLQTAADNLKEHLDFGKVLAIFTGVSLVVGISKFSAALTDLSGAAGQVKTTLSTINNIINAKFGNSFASNAKAIAGAVVAIATSLFLLSAVPKEDLINATTQIGSLMVLLGVLAGVMTYVSTKLTNKQRKSLTGLVKPLLGLSAAMLILSVAAKNASTAIGEGENVWKRVGAILALIGGLGLELIGMSALLGVVGGKVTVAAVVLMIVSLAIMKLAQAVKLLENIKLSEDAIKLAWIVGVIMVIGILASAVTKVGKGLSGFANAGIGILAFVASIYILTLAIEKITSEGMKPTWEKFGNSIGTVIPVLLVLAGITTVLVLVGKHMKGTAEAVAKISIGVLAMVGAMYFMMVLFKKLSEFSDVDSYAAGIIGVAVLGILVMGMMSVLGTAAQKANGGKGVLKLVAGVVLMTAAIGVLMLLFKAMAALTKGMAPRDVLTIEGYLLGLAAILGGLVIAVGYAAKLGGGKGLGILVGAIAGITVLALMLIALTSFTWDQMKGALGAIFICALALGGVMLAIGFAVQAATKNKGGAAGLYAAMGILIGVGALLAILSTRPWGQMVVAALSMGGVLLALAFSMQILGKAEFNLGNVLAAVGVLAAVFAGLYFVIPKLEALAKVDTMGLLKNMGILVAAVAILVVVAGVLAGVASIVPGMQIALFGVAAVLVGIAAVVGVFAAAMYYLQSVNWTAIATGLMQVAEPMIQLGTAGLMLIIAAVGVALIAAAIWVLGLACDSSASGIVMFNVALIGLGNTLSAIGNAFQNANGNLLAGLANLRDEFSTSAESTAESAKMLWQSIADSGSGQNAGAAFDGVVEVSGEKGAQSGTNYATEFNSTASEEIANGGTLDGINDNAETKGTEGGQAYSQAYNENAQIEIDNEEPLAEATEDSGTAGGEAGKAWYDNFGLNLEEGMKKLPGNVQDMIKKYAPEGGFDISSLFGGNSMMPDLDFSGTDPEEIKNKISAFAGNMVDTEGFSNAGQENTKAFVSGLVAYLGSGEASEAASSAIISWLQENMTADGLASVGTDVGNNVVTEANTALENSSDSTSTSIWKMLSTAVGKVDWTSIGDLVSGNFISSMGTSFLKSQGASEVTLSGNFVPLFTQIAEITDLSESADTFVTNFIGKISKGLTSISNLNELNKAGASMGSEVNSGGKSVSTDSTGSYWGEGLANGVWGWSQKIWQKGYDLAKKLINGTKTGIDSNSPSKEAYKLGEYFDMGLMNAVVAGYDEVENVAYVLGTRACDGLNDGIQNGIEGGITPVLDMSDVTDTLGDFDGTYRPVIKPTLDMSDVDPALSNMNAVAAYMGNRGGSDGASAENPSPTSFNFVQNNYSPKALSRIDIYRQTRNQFSTVKDMIKA